MGLDRLAAQGNLIDNILRIRNMLTQVIADPTQSSIDALIAAAKGAGIVQPKPSQSLDGESWDWLAYQQFLSSMLRTELENEQLLGGAWEVRSRGVSA